MWDPPNPGSLNQVGQVARHQKKGLQARGAAEEGEIFKGLPEGRAEAQWEELRLPGDSSCREEQRDQ